MSDSLTTRLDVPYAQQPETRAAARRYLERSGNADVIAILGLDDAQPDPPAYESRGGKLYCRVCERRVQSDGVCRRADCHGGNIR